MGKMRRVPIAFVTFGTGLLGTSSLSLMGSTAEFPSRYQTSVRGLSQAILDARPVDVEFLEFPVSLQDWSRWMLKMRVSGDMERMKHEVVRIERHFRRIQSMRGSRNLQSFLPAAFTRDDNLDIFRLTSYADYYNVFFLDSPVVASLYWKVKAAFRQYAQVYNLDLTRPYFIHGWFNCFRGGGKIRFHRHGYGLAGNVAVHVPPGSYTRYGSLVTSKEYPWMLEMQHECNAGQQEACEELANIWKYEGALWDAAALSVEPTAIPNAEGELVMFHGLVEHESSNVTEEMRQHLKQSGPTDCRMTLAFDIDTDPSALHHSLPLYDPKDPWWMEDGHAHIGDAIGAKIERLYQESDLPMVFDWDVLPDSRAFHDRMRKALRHEGSALLSAWSKQQVKECWAGLRSSY